jgi:hypothetical protein
MKMVWKQEHCYGKICPAFDVQWLDCLMMLLHDDGGIFYIAKKVAVKKWRLLW